ncbi:MAG: HDOD domain-containing protein [Betaproteobacteria bacterium]
MPDINDLFKSVALPVMPEVGVALINTLDNPKTELSKINDLISQDPTLTAKLLALANSAAFGLSRKVANLSQALQLVGISRIRTMALSACLHNAFSMPEGIDSTEFWRYSMDCAGYAQWLGKGLADTQDVDSHNAWLVGLMLRLGELIIAQAHPEMVELIEKSPCAPGERWARERELTGFDEAEVTAELARRWNFPPAIVHGLLLASDPMVNKPIDALAGIAHLASMLADQPDATANAIETLPVPVMDALELKYGWMKASFPASASFLTMSSLTG